MATNNPNLSTSPTQVRLSRDLAAVHAWRLLRLACGHSRPFFDDGPASLPVEPCAPIRPVLTGAEVLHV